MLRVVLEFNHVVVSVRAPHEMRLGTPTHSSELLDRVQRVRGKRTVRPGSDPTWRIFGLGKGPDRRIHRNLGSGLHDSSWTTSVIRIETVLRSLHLPECCRIASQ